MRALGMPRREGHEAYDERKDNRDAIALHGITFDVMRRRAELEKLSVEQLSTEVLSQPQPEAADSPSL
jgi:hypothetical protein